MRPVKNRKVKPKAKTFGWEGMMVLGERGEVGCDGVGERRKSVILGPIVHQVPLALDLT